MNISHLYNKTVKTYRSIDSVDSGRSPVSSFSVNISSLPCRLQQETGEEPIIGGRKESKISYTLYCDEDADIIMKDVILYNSDTYEIIEFSKEANNNTYIKILIEKNVVKIG